MRVYAHWQKQTPQQRTQSLLTQYPHIQHITDATGLYALSQDYLCWMREHNYSELSIENREVKLCALIDWLGERQLFYPVQISKPMLDRYQRTLFYQRKRDGKPLSFKTQGYHIAAIRCWFKWLMRQDYIAGNPASELQMPRVERRLPKSILSRREIETVLHQPDIHDALGLRDRAILEVFYSCGIRRTELSTLKITDVDLTECMLMVRQGKGKKDRFIPLGERAAAWVEKYLYESRTELSCARDNGELFLSLYGTGFRPNGLTTLVRKHILGAGINKVGSCHLFRHAMATHMLENGADIRFIQVMLGHAQITTTELYAQVSVKKLKEVHAKTHPSAGLVKKEQEKDVVFVSLEESEEMLLSMLAAENDEEPQLH